MKIFITGATGLIGSLLVKTLLIQKHEIVILTRNTEKAKLKFGTDVGYYQSLNTITSFDGYDAVINLAGESIAGKRWSSKQRKKLLDSRLIITEKLAELINKSDIPPTKFISGSAIGYYGDGHYDTLIESSKPRDNFTHQLCQQWEDSALKAKSEKTRVCLLRTGIVLSSEGGMLPKMALPFKLGLGSIMGRGKQYISWIHIEDMVNAICYLLMHPKADGAFNMVAPIPVTNKVFSIILAKTLHRPCWFRIPSFVIRLLMGNASVLVLKSFRAIPQKLESMGYDFHFDNLEKALRDILNKQRIKNT